MAKEEKIKTAIRIGVIGLWRFYDDGFVRWPRNKLTALFSNLDLEKPEIQQEFESLEKKELIRLLRTDDCYLEVLRAPDV